MGRGGKVHDLDCWPAPFEAVRLGDKTAEIRVDDRGFAVGDLMRLNKLRHGRVGAARCAETPPIDCVISHKLHGGQFGLQAGYCLLSFRPAGPAVTALIDRELGRR